MKSLRLYFGYDCEDGTYLNRFKDFKTKKERDAFIEGFRAGGNYSEFYAEEDMEDYLNDGFKLILEKNLRKLD